MNECSIFIQVIFALRSWWRESVSDWVSAPAWRGSATQYLEEHLMNPRLSGDNI